jgi:hypothetical protein
MNGVIHFWRVIGHLLGIEDQFNLCSASNKKQVETRCRTILKCEIDPCMRQVTESTTSSDSTSESRTAVAMTYGIQCAMNGIVRFLYPGTQKKFLYHVFGFQSVTDNMKLGAREQLMFNLMTMTLSELIRFPPVRLAMNGLLKLALERSERLPKKRLERVQKKYGDDPLFSCLASDDLTKNTSKSL